MGASGQEGRSAGGRTGRARSSGADPAGVGGAAWPAYRRARRVCRQNRTSGRPPSGSQGSEQSPLRSRVGVRRAYVPVPAFPRFGVARQGRTQLAVRPRLQVWRRRAPKIPEARLRAKTAFGPRISLFFQTAARPRQRGESPPTRHQSPPIVLYKPQGEEHAKCWHGPCKRPDLGLVPGALPKRRNGASPFRSSGNTAPASRRREDALPRSLGSITPQTPRARQTDTPPRPKLKEKKNAA